MEGVPVKRVLTVAPEFARQAVKLLQLTLWKNDGSPEDPPKQDTAWPASRDFAYEAKAEARFETILNQLRSDLIPYEEWELYHGDSYYLAVGCLHLFRTEKGCGPVLTFAWHPDVLACDRVPLSSIQPTPTITRKRVLEGV